MIDASELGFGDLSVEVVVEPRSFENFEWFINGVIQKDKSIELQVQYNSDLFSAQSMEFYFEGFEAFLNEIIQRPDAIIAEYQTMSVPQRQLVIVDWNETAIDYPVSSTLDQEFSRQALATPGKIAVQFENESLTYREVESRSNQIARYLQSQGVASGSLVGICVERSAQMLVTLYGILKSGAGYVPLDPAYPDDRLQYMCEHSGLQLVVTESSLTDRVAGFEKPQVAIDSVVHDIAKLDDLPVESKTVASDICYVIYTSGSTGKPKGVQVPHGAVVNFLYSMRQTPGFAEDDSVLAVTTLSFDIAVLELYLPTIFGGKVVILDALKAADGAELSKQLVQHDISLLQATPATWRLMIQAQWEGKSNLKVLCGGEPMPQDLVEPLLSRCGELWNMYGPTETTVWSAAYQITNANAPILIGKPIGNTQIYILDANGNEVPVGCEGEVFIGGAGVTIGYRNRDDLTAERFVTNRYRSPFANFVNDKLYKTGDLAKYRFDGNIQFLRRNDKQVKVRGYRIELGEIEQNIKSHPAIEQNVVVVREDKPGDARLVAYVIVKSEQTITNTELRDHLRKTVPHYMVPQNFVELESMPQTNNGKIDYNALPEPQTDSSESSPSEGGAVPETEAEIYLADLWKEVLSTDDVGLNDTFFDIGGHSLLVMKVIALVHDTTGIKLGPQDFLMSTLEQMADMIAESHAFQRPDVADDQSEPSSTSTPTFKSEEVATVTVETDRHDDVAESQSNRSTGIFQTLKGFWD
jgi:amino acid adenylation domain-containing protein